MFVQRNKGELYLQGGTQPGQRKISHGWAERIDPITLEPIAQSPRLPSGGHNWCGAACVHENGDIYVVNGRYCHRLSPDLEVVAEHRLETDNAHNGHVVLSDGALAMKDIQNDPKKRSVFTLLDPNLKLIERFELPTNSVGRFSVDRRPDCDLLYVTGPREIFRLVYRDRKLSLDESWRASYAIPGADQSFAWDSTLGDECAWFMDMGENAGVQSILGSFPIGTNNFPPARAASMFLTAVRVRLGLQNRARFLGQDPIHSAPQRVFRVSLNDPADRDVLVAFGLAGGNIIAPPLYDQDRRILVAHDLMNAKIGAWRYNGPGQMERLWTRDWLNTNQMTLFADTGELLLDDVKPFRRWDALVVDIESGAEKGRVDTGCLASSGMWYTPGWARDCYTSTSFGRIARIWVEG